MSALRTIVILALLASVSVGSGIAQEAPPKKGPSRIKQVVGKLADTALTSAAALGVDTLLGQRGAALSQLISPQSQPGGKCPAGTSPMAPNQANGVGPALPSVPSPGGMLVNAVKKKMAGAKATAAAPDTAKTPAVACVTAEQALQLQKLAAGAAPAANPAAPAASGPAAGLTTALAASPAGLAIAGAAAAAPLAGQAVKGLGGLFKKGPSKENMIKDIAKGRLVLKGVRFIEGSDVLADGFEESLSVLADALSALGGKFLLNLPAEAADHAQPDTTMARRRLTALSARLKVAGIGDDRLVLLGIYPPGLDSTKKAPKPGDTRAEVLKLPSTLDH